MKTYVAALIVGLLCLYSEAKQTPPKIQVYSQEPGRFGKNNTLICHVSCFYPPVISLQLLKDGKEMTSAVQSDLAFEENWQYHITKHAPFTPLRNERFTCNVTHLGRSNIYIWEADM